MAAAQWNSQYVANHLLQATAGFRPTLDATGGPNGGPCLTGDGTDDLMQAAFTQAQPETVYAVAKMAAGTTGTLFDGATSNAMRLARSSATELFMYAGTQQFTPATQTPTAWHIYRADFSAATSLLDVDGTNVIAANVGAASAGGLTLFSMGGAGFDFSATSFAEVVMFAASVPAYVDTRLRARLRSMMGIA